MLTTFVAAALACPGYSLPPLIPDPTGFECSGGGDVACAKGCDDTYRSARKGAFGRHRAAWCACNQFDHKCHLEVDDALWDDLLLIELDYYACLDACGCGPVVAKELTVLPIVLGWQSSF